MLYQEIVGFPLVLCIILSLGSSKAFIHVELGPLKIDKKI